MTRARTSPPGPRVPASIVLLDWQGRPGWAQSTELMPVGWMSPAVGELALPF